jgi:hypothetical protein
VHLHGLVAGGHGPFSADEGQRWYSLNIMIFRDLARPGEHAAEEAQLDRSIRFARMLAYIYWIGILTVAFLGAVKPL